MAGGVARQAVSADRGVAVNAPTAYLLAAACMGIHLLASFAATRRRIRVGTPTRRDLRRQRIVGDWGLAVPVLLLAALWPIALVVLASNLLDRRDDDNDPQDHVPPTYR